MNKKIFLTFSLIGFFIIKLQASEGAYLASDLLGQLDASDQPVFTTSTVNNYSANNNRGFDSPVGVELDSVNHRLFVSDNENNRILVFNLDANDDLIDRTADYALCQPDFLTTSTGLTAAKCSDPIGIVYDSTNDRLFVADAFNNRVLVFDTASITTGEDAVSVLGQTDFTSKTASTSQTGLGRSAFSSGPVGLAHDSANNRLFVSDFSNTRVMVWTVTSTITDGQPADYVLGEPDFTSFTNSTSTLASSSMANTFGLAYDPDNQRLFAVDSNLVWARVLVFDVATSTIANGMGAIAVIGQSDFNSTSSPVANETSFGFTYALFYHTGIDRLFVPDANQNRVLIFPATSTITNGVAAVNIFGQTDFNSSSSAITQSGLTTPYGIVYDSGNNRLYVVDGGNHRVLAFDISTITNGENATDVIGQFDASGAVSFTTNTPNNGIQQNNRGLNLPAGSIIDYTNHRLFLADSGNNRVLVFNLDSNNDLVDRLADYVLGQSDFNATSSATTQNGLKNPIGVEYDSVNNRLFVADANNHRIVVYDVASITNGENAVAVIGQSDFTTGTSTSTENGFNTVVGSTYDATNERLFVSDAFNSRILIFPATSTITNGTPAINVIGQPDFTTVSGGTTQSKLNFAFLNSYDSENGRLFVPDTMNNRVMVFPATSTITNGVAAVNVLGQTDFTSNGGATTQGGLKSPVQAVYDSAHKRLFVADGHPQITSNKRVVIFDVASITDGENAVGVLGQGDFTSAASGFTQGNLSSAVGLHYDSGNNRLYVSDYSGNRIMIYNFVTITSTSTPSSGTQGTAYSHTINTTSSQGTVTFQLASGTLPAGLSLGSITGTPTESGTFNFTVYAVDTVSGIGNFVGSQDYTLTITSSGGGGDQQQQSSTGGTVDIASLQPFTPALPLKFLINNGAPTTNSRYVTLNFSAKYILPGETEAADAKSFKAATNPDLSNSLGQEPYSVSVPFDLCLNQTACPAKNYTVYVTFYTQGGQPSQVISDSITLTSDQTQSSTQANRAILEAKIKELQTQLIKLLQQLLQLIAQSR